MNQNGPLVNGTKDKQNKNWRNPSSLILRHNHMFLATCFWVRCGSGAFAQGGREVHCAAGGATGWWGFRAFRRVSSLVHGVIPPFGEEYVFVDFHYCCFCCFKEIYHYNGHICVLRHLSKWMHPNWSILMQELVVAGKGRGCFLCMPKTAWGPPFCFCCWAFGPDKTGEGPN